MKEDLCDWEADLLAGTGKGALGIDGDYRQGSWGYHRVKIGEGLHKGLVLKRRGTKGNLDITRCGALSEYHDIWQIRTHTFELGSGQVV